MRRLIEITTASAGWMGRVCKRHIPYRHSVIKLNLGCGLAVHTGWINIDGSLNTLIASLPSIVHRAAYRMSGSSSFYTFEEYQRILSENTFFHADLSHGVPARDDSVDYIYSSHFLEHLYPSEANALLVSCYQVLKPGGMIRIGVPDLEYALDMYRAGSKRECLDRYFFVEAKGSVYARHKYMYDFELLTDMLRKAGFGSVDRCRYRQGNVPDVEFLDNRPEETLFVEARK